MTLYFNTHSYLYVIKQKNTQLILPSSVIMAIVSFIILRIPNNRDSQREFILENYN